MTLSSLGLEKLTSLKAFGNQQLRELPHFRSANSLALTYAYHCCDYLKDLINPDSEGIQLHQNEDQPLDSPFNESSTGLVEQLMASISSKFNHLLSGKAANKIEAREDRLNPSAGLETSNLTEVIVWPVEYYRDSAVDSKTYRPRVRRQQKIDDKQTTAIGEDFSIGNLNSFSKGLVLPEVWPQQSLIDELVWQVSEIRRAHSDLGAVESDKQAAGLPWRLARRAIGNERLNLSRQLTDMMNLTPSGQHDELASALIEARLSERVASELRKVNQAEMELRSRRHLQVTSNKDRQQFVTRCLPEPNAFMPCQDLFDTWWLRTGIWLVFLLAFIGNILVIVVLSSVRQSSSASALTSIMWLAHSKRHIDVPRFLVINLAIADLLMAFYLGILAVVDLSTLGQFKLFAIKWQYSTGCKLAGFLGVLSSELSVFILAIITLERNYAITNAVHLNRRLSLQKAMLIMFIGYTLALGMAIMPLNGISDYRKFSICLPLDMDSSLSSQLYIIALIGINTISFILLLSCYLRMYCAIRGSQAWNTNDLRIAKRMSILVLTDFICWMPIIVVGLASLFGHHLVGTNGIKILTIFILPLNSVANPFLYAITTKKFKRDLDTLFRRARSAASLNCTKTNKDPKVFFGYNQYQHELRMNKARKKKFNNLLDNRHSHLNQRSTNGQADGSRAAYNAAHNQAIYTANQVTMNRTTCSCGAQRAIPVHQRAAGAYDSTTAPSSESAEAARRDQSHSNVAMHHLQPKIVLDSAEPLDEVDSAPSKKSQLTNCGLNADGNGIGAAAPDRCSSAFAAGPTGGTNQRVVVPYRCRDPHRSCCCHCRADYQNAVLCGNLARANRPKSADTGAVLGSDRAGNNRASYQTVCFVAEGDSSTTSSHLVATNRGDEPKQRNFLSVLNNTEANQKAGDRSASACGYPAISKAGCTASSSAVSATHLRPIAGSYDTVSASGEAKTARSTEKLSHSINKLLFGPVAKAWSSIQISLNSSLTQVATSQNLQVSRRTSPAVRRDCGASAMSIRRDKIDEYTMQASNTNDNSTTIDDLLIIGSPSSRLLRLNERRMSRSCDIISSQVAQQNLATLSNTSTSGNEPTTSQGDHDDDRRILLATINRIAGVHHKHGQQAVQQQQQYLRNRCTRCRSWSPALLSKLEDCIYQLKFKIPGLSSNKGANHGTHHEAMEQDESSGRDIDADGLDQPGDDEEQEMPFHGMGDGSDDSDDCDEDSEDKFNERGLLEWSQRRQNMMKRHHYQRQSIKSNTNSDTLSTRTGGTMLTNMSVSFDSNTGVPVPCNRMTFSDGENRANEANEMDD